jgi:CHAT domain-containing protein
MLSDRLGKTDVQSKEGRRLLDRLEKLGKSLNELRQEAAMQNKPLAQVFALDPVTVKQVQNVLDPDAALLEYSIGDQYVTLWIITKETIGHRLISVAEETVLQEYLKTLREPLMGLGNISKHVALGKELYRTLLGKATDYLTDKKRLIIAPDGPLYYVPFETLIEASAGDDTNKYSSLADVPYLIKQFAVSYIPSASVLVAQYSQNKTQKQSERLPLLAFGDPVYRGEITAKTPEVQSRRITNLALRGLSFDRLEFSGEEVRRISSVWGIPPTSEHLNVRDRASVNRVREIDLTKYRVVHFASHAVLGDTVGFASQPALVLSQTGGDETNGLLQFSDILELKLNADLVVLSACETGLGQLREGEGIVGLTRAFFYAGASSAIVSLWKVEDQSTALLMEKFYQHLRNGKDKTEALRQAKLEIIKTSIALKATGSQHSLAAPFFWAPFILAGDSGPIVQ